MTPKQKHMQAGAATLVVVMVLFLIMAMMAAYANRNMIFEQRIASNYYRTGVSSEAADAGLEWTVAMLNGLGVNASCRESAGASERFRDRFLNIASDRTITEKVTTGYLSNCVRTNAGASWACRCPSPDAAGFPAPVAVAAGDTMQPGFVVSITPPPVTSPTLKNRPGAMRVKVEGCSSGNYIECRDPSAVASQLLSLTVAEMDVALVSALKNPPASPLTVKGALSVGTSGLGLHNSDPRSAGILLVSGRPAVASLNPYADRLDSLPGTPGLTAIIENDSTLTSSSAARMFSMYFGMTAPQYRDQPAMRMVNCPNGTDCGSTLLAAYNRGVRMAWIEGPLILNSNNNLGTETNPMVIIATGDVAIDGPMTISGLLYTRGDLIWANASADVSMLKGALLVEGDMEVSGRVDLWYRSAVIDALKNQTGSFVRVPGSWWN